MHAVESVNLTKRFGSFTAVNNVNIAIKQGSIYGFLGPNGSGKSTTIKMLCGILEPTSGSGTILGLDLARDSEAIKTKIGYMSQKFSLYDDLTVLENLEFYAGMYSLSRDMRKNRIEEMLDMAGLKHRQNDMAANLSGGYKQRLALGCAILHKPPILFLDEPTGGVDPKSRRMFWDIIYNLAVDGTTVMVTTHFMDEAEHCDEIGFIFEGNLIASDAPDQLKKNIPGLLLEIPAVNPMGLLEELTTKNIKALDMYPYGTSIHALVLPDQLAAFAAYQYKIISPSLEDVFVFYVQSHRKELMA
ncbi:Vitamin B12 import ATP-binding protein BtuD [Sporomusa carbonis]|uniref:ABC transporter ATP-binding protein n=1 Tax=Sporomusa carbonis TaxID=3076075 RepID=UPI003A7AAA33